MPIKKTPPKKAAVRSARRQRIAEDVLAGRKIAEIAREEGVSRSWASREAHAPETQALIADMVNIRQPFVGELLDRSLQVIRDAQEAMTYQNSGPKEYTLCPDHYARLTAVHRFTALVMAGRPAPKLEVQAKHGPLTLDQIQAVIDANKAAR